MKNMIDPWGSVLVKDYEKVIDQFGLDNFNPKLFPEPNSLMRRQVVFAARDQGQIGHAILKKKPFYALSGIVPSAEKIHFGTKMVVENLEYFQEQGAKTYILVADLEAAAARGISLEEARKRAMDFHIPAYIALGLDLKKTFFYFQSDNKEVMNKAYEFAKKITYNEFKAIYGSADPGKIMSTMVQVADILYPQFHERMPGVIPVGIDQDPHIRLTRDIVQRMKSEKFFLPSAIYHKFTPSLDGSLKMSKSKPESCIELPEDPEKVIKKLKKAKTGGRETVEEQKKKGGEPEKCIIFELEKQHLLHDDKELDQIYKDCKCGKLMCGEHKEKTCQRMVEFLAEFERKLAKAKKNVNKLKFIKFRN